MFIKVCGMRDSSNIQEIARIKPDLMGFIFYPASKRYVGETFDPGFVYSLMPEVKTVGVFVNEEYNKLLSIARRFRFDIIQLHGTESPLYCQNVKARGFQVWKAFGVHSAFDWEILHDYQNVCDSFLFDTSTRGHGGSGVKFDWEILGNYSLTRPFILSGGIGPEDAAGITAIKHPLLKGVDINSCFETEPGLKDVERVKEFIGMMRNRTSVS